MIRSSNKMIFNSLGRVIRSFHSPRRYQFLYNILESNPNSSKEEIKNNFIRLSKIYHPDNLETGNKQKFIRLKDAYEAIKEAPLKINESLEGNLSHKALIRHRERAKLSDSWTSKPKGGYKTVKIELYRF